MFLLNNIRDRRYRPEYPDHVGVFFDISDAQLANAKNSAWNEIKPGDIACVIRSSRTFDTFYRVEQKLKTDKVDEDGAAHVLIGSVIAKMVDSTGMQILLKKFSVKHPLLPKSQFIVGFNIANLGTALDALEVKTRDGNVTIGELAAP